MKRISAVLIVCALVALTSSGALLADPPPTAPGADNRPTLLDIALSPGFSTLAAAATCQGLVPALLEPRPLTVFAPTDAAFANLGLNAGNICSFDFEGAVGSSLFEILAYHVVPGRYPAAKVIHRATLPTLNGAPLTVNLGAACAGGTVCVDTSTVVLADQKASNGVAHVIDSVLLPPAP